MRKLAIIPARKGSKRIPDKNIKDFCGQPMIKYAIDAAKNTTLFEKIVVSTDGDKIGNYSSEQDCVYYERPSHLEGPGIGMADIIIDVLQFYQECGEFYDYVCMLYACSPFATSMLLEKSYRDLIEGEYDVVYPVYNGPQIERVLMKRDKEMLSRFPQYDTENSNNWLDAYYHAGIFFWSCVSTLMLYKNFMRGKQYGYEVNWWEGIDIDTPDDWEKAEILYKNFNRKEG